MNDSTLLDQDPHYEADHPKLQFLFVLIPVVGVFLLYAAFRLKHNRERRREFLELELSHVLANGVVFTSSATNTHSDQMTSAQDVVAPPPVYSICSPPKYEDIVIEHQERSS